MTPDASPEITGSKMASDYMARQHWKMKWVSALISGLMATFTIKTGTWILEVEFWPWAGLMLIVGISQWQLNKLFIEHARHMQAGNEYPLPTLMKTITQHAWIQLGTALLAWYWIIMLGYVSFFAEIPPTP